MLFLYFQWFLVILVCVFTGYVLYNRYSNSTSDENHTTESDITDAHVSSPHASVSPSSSPPSRQPLTTADSATLPMYYKPTDTTRQYHPVWIPVDTMMSKVLQDYRSQDDPSTWALSAGDGLSALPVSQIPPDFADVFRGYQRLALLTIFLAFGRQHKIIFVHKGNWHKILPHLSGQNPVGSYFRSNAMSEAMRQDYIKSQILAHYGGYWCPPDTIITHSDLHAFLHDVVIKKARSNPSLPYDTPVMLVAGQQELPFEGATRFVTDSSFIFAEPRNPVLLDIANQLQVIVTKSYDHGGYEYNHYFPNTLHQYATSPMHASKAVSIIRLPSDVNGTIDERGDPVKADHYFRQRPLDHLPHPNIHWFVVNSTDGRITQYPNYEWFAYLSEEAIVQSQMWISMVYRKALHMDSSSSSSGHVTQADGMSTSTCTGGNYKLTVSLRDEDHPLREVWVRGWKSEW